MPSSFSISARIGVHRRTISGADSVESSANVISFGQVGSPAPAMLGVFVTASASVMTRTSVFMDGLLARLDHCAPDARRDHVHTHDEGDDEQDHRSSLPIVEGPDRVPEVEPNTTAAHHPDDR